jgi:hypothetical protein
MNDFAVVGTILVSVVCGSIFLFIAYREFWSRRKSQRTVDSHTEKPSDEVPHSEQETVHA